MPKDTFKDYVLEQLSAVPEVHCRPMFSGYGLYLGKNFFGIISDAQLYFRTDDMTSQRYKTAGMKPFAPSDKQILKNYYEVPVEVLEDRNSLETWAREAASLE